MARAKINLFLHVGALQPDGYHPLSSLVAFADVGDGITVERADRLSLDIVGPLGGSLRSQPDNLILTALRALGEAAGIGEPALKITLDKALPIAAGLGGGSSDAGTALKLARDVLALEIDDAALEVLAGVVGADGAMCLRARTAWAEGRGDVLTEEPRLPVLNGVLFNPGVPSSTGAVYRAFDQGPTCRLDHGAPADWSAGTVIAWLATLRNDLEAPAIALAPAIGQALVEMQRQAGVGLSRMSGSGATVIGLFERPEDADAAARVLSDQATAGWVRRTRIGGFSIA